MAESAKQAPDHFPESEAVLLAAGELSQQRLWHWPQPHFRGNLLKVRLETADDSQEEIDEEDDSKTAQQNGGPDTDAVR